MRPAATILLLALAAAPVLADTGASAPENAWTALRYAACAFAVGMSAGVMILLALAGCLLLLKDEAY